MPPPDGRSKPSRRDAETARRDDAAGGVPASANGRGRRAERAWPAEWWWETDAALRYTFLSAGFTEATGFDRRTLVGGPLLHDLPPDGDPLPGAAEAARATAARLPFRELLLRAAGRDGGPRFWLVGGRPVLELDGRFRGYRGQGCDVTAIVGFAHAPVADREERGTSTLLANVSHELRTPLNAILGFSEMLREPALAPDGTARVRDYAGYIHESAAHLLAIVNDILDLAKSEAGRAVLQEEPVDLAGVIHAVCRLMQHRAAAGDLRLEARIAEPLPLLRGDERAILQIVTNLVSNAMKFTPPRGDVRIEATLQADGAEAGILIGVHDTGIGMAETDIPIALTPFGQVAPPLRPEDQGTGLGLPLTRSLVERHQGRLQIRSAPGVGTSVLVHFPAARIVAQESGGAPAFAGG